MSNEQLTDAQLSERVCKALGIEPRREWVVGNEAEKTIRISASWSSRKQAQAWLYMMRQQNLHTDQDVWQVEIYPSVLDWPGFGRVVERLEGIGLHFTFSNYPSGHMVELWPAADIAYGKADTLPRALALAVLEWEASR